MARAWFVKEGDTWESIAIAVGVSPEVLMRWNGLDTRASALPRPQPGACLCASDPSEDRVEPVGHDERIIGVDDVDALRPRWRLTFASMMQIIGFGCLGITLVVRAVSCSGVLKKKVGEFAWKPDDCRSGQLLSAKGTFPLAVGGRCTMGCVVDGDCAPSALRCFQGRCAPPATKDLGGECSAPWDCRSSDCVSIVDYESPGRSQSVCTVPCSRDAPCPEGYGCKKVDDKRLCVALPIHRLAGPPFPIP